MYKQKANLKKTKKTKTQIKIVCSRSYDTGV